MALTDDERQTVAFLDVPYEDKDIVQKLGAKWDSFYRKWYVPLNLNNSSFTKWFGKTPDFNLSPCSITNPRLYIDLVPQTSWTDNLSQQFATKDWNLIRKFIYQKANNVCEVCGNVGPKGRIDAHERWHYDDKSKTQILTNISALCPTCHLATHLGFAETIGKLNVAEAQLGWINLWTPSELLIHKKEAFALWHYRSQFEWITDVTWIFNQNLSLSKKTLDILTQSGECWFLDKSKIKTINSIAKQP